MADKFLKIGASGFSQEQEAITTSSGAADAGKIPALNSSGLIDPTMIGTSESLTMVASETLSAGDFVNFWNDSGTIKMRKATNTGIATQADGYVKAGVTSGASGTVNRDNGLLTGLSSLVVGTRYFLGTAGAVTATIPTGSGSIVQFLGVAQTTTALLVDIEDPIERA
jgi:hypothetical protein